MMTDADLLRCFAETRSEEAFAELVRRHLDLVFSAALRQANGDVHLAQDVAQIVFTDLARKADALSRRQVLNGWLYTSALFAATKAVRTERRRRAREQEAQVMHSLSIDSPREVDWSALRPVIDEAMLQLREEDRDAVLLRYFEKRPLAEIGAKLGVTENAARMRVERALDKLRDQLVRRGVTTTTTALSAVVVANAIQAAPVGLAATLTSLSLAGAAGTAGSTLTLLKIMSMTKLQLGVSAVIIAGATTALVLQHRTQSSLRVENQSLQQQLNQLQSDNENLSKLLTRPKNVPALSLPAPRVTASASTIDTTTDWNSTNLIVRMQRGEKAPALTAQQAEAYLNENHRSAASLLAAFRATGDKTLLEEATQKFPGDPQVAFTAAYASDAPPEEQRRWLDAFKSSAPENALADFLSASGHFKAGEPDQAIQELSAAFGKQTFQDYSWDFIQNGQEAYRAAGYPEVEARIIPTMSLILPQLKELKQLNGSMLDLAAAYRQAGDESSAVAALQMDAALGRRLSAPGNTALITQLVGMTIESLALRQMDPTSAFDSNGQTVKDRLDQINQRKSNLTQFAKQLDDIYMKIPASDWISYHDRWQSFGEEDAMMWLLNKYERK